RGSLPRGHEQPVHRGSHSRSDPAVPGRDHQGNVKSNPYPRGIPVTDPHSATQGETAGTAIDTSVPHSARIWNYWLGGKDNYAVDREAGDQYREIFPGIAVVA